MHKYHRSQTLYSTSKKIRHLYTILFNVILVLSSVVVLVSIYGCNKPSTKPNPKQGGSTSSGSGSSGGTVQPSSSGNAGSEYLKKILEKGEIFQNNILENASSGSTSSGSGSSGGTVQPSSSGNARSEHINKILEERKKFHEKLEERVEKLRNTISEVKNNEVDIPSLEHLKKLANIPLDEQKAFFKALANLLLDEQEEFFKEFKMLKIKRT